MWPKHLPKPDPARQGIIWKLPELFQWVNHHMMTVAVVIVGLAILKVAWQKGRRPLWDMIRADLAAAGRAVFRRPGKRRQTAGLPNRLQFVDDGGPVDMVPYGVGTDGKWLHADLTGTTPHVLISAPTGWGKTSFMSIFAAWVSSRGGTVDICDPKMIGFEVFEGVPNIQIHTEIEDMAETITAFRKEVQERYRARKAGANINDRERYPLRLLILDEMGTLVVMLKRYYDREIKQRGDPSEPPWFEDVLIGLWQGRAAGCHIITGAQQANAQVLISSDARDQYGLKIAAGPQSHNAWAMLYGPSTRPISPGEKKGRAIAGIGAQLQTVQLAMINPDQARELALAGRPDPGPPGPGSTSTWSPDTPPETDLQWPADDSQDERQDAEPDQGRPERWTADDDQAAAELLAGQGQADPEPTPEPGHFPRKRGRPPAERRPPVPVSCQCGHTWQSRARDGSWVKCPKCRTSCRVPERDQPAA